MALASWQHLYGARALDRSLPASTQAAVGQIADHCLYGREAFEAIPASTVRALTLRHSPPWNHAPWRQIAAENTPGLTPISVPVLITQGDADHVVPPRTTARLVRRLCAEGVPVQERLYPSLGHLEAGIVVAPDVASWIAERFAGAPAPNSCPG
jgi:acetyl esterase/lipase